ncbi:hypothetical protein LX81_00295 [Palleronia aestuarii]|uniref:Uncharacterized protein n=1 Tax=Palleronia aestuarii TaxID=568105 RepID=A0A2W7P8Z0_9RHOB|nr:hypothetical protein [Palleronia aestuarii]PZX19832.1 hypothetical protein LX81_00295 [Palleronia aestuarii]
MKIIEIDGRPYETTGRDITEFHHGETVTILVRPQNGQRQPLDLADQQDIYISFASSAAGEPIHQFYASLHEQVAWITDSAVPAALIRLAYVDLPNVAEASTFYYNIWTKLPGEDPILQERGKIILAPSILGTLLSIDRPTITMSASFDPAEPVEGSPVTFLPPVAAGTAPMLSLSAVSVDGESLIDLVVEMDGSYGLTAPPAGELTVTWVARNAAGEVPDTVTTTIAKRTAPQPGFSSGFSEGFAA